MIVIGGGVIGLEMGTVWRRLGAEVEVIEYLPRILPGMDNEIADKFMKIMQKQGIKFKLGHSVESAQSSDSKVTLTIKNVISSNIEKVEADVVLVAIGRKPNTSGLGLKELGLEVDKQGFINTNHNFETSIPDIYAIGDVIKGPMLAHKAEEDGVAAVEIINGEAGHVDYNLVPGIIYTSPEVAVIGQTEENLKDQKIEYNKGVFPLSANSRAKAIGHTDGMVKILSDKSTDKILGAHIIGHEAGTVIHELSVAMGFGASSEDVARICHGHPTINEAVKEAAAIDALKEYPAVNAEIEGNEIIYKNYYNIGVAVGTSQGLVVPVIKDADKMTIGETEITIAQFGKKAKEGNLAISDMAGGTFTISNGGVYGSLMSSPILNPPQSGILGMHKIQKRPVAIGNNIEIRPMMYLALSYDHRIIDGREAVSFLVRIKEIIEDPRRLVIGA